MWIICRFPTRYGPFWIREGACSSSLNTLLQNGLRFDDTRHLLQMLVPEALADVSQSAALGVAKSELSREMRAENSALRGEVFPLEEQALVAVTGRKCWLQGATDRSARAQWITKSEVPWCSAIESDSETIILAVKDSMFSIPLPVEVSQQHNGCISGIRGFHHVGASALEGCGA